MRPKSAGNCGADIAALTLTDPEVSGLRAGRIVYYGAKEVDSVRSPVAMSTGRTPKSPQNRTAALNILLVEDDIETSEFVARGLREAGFGVDCVADGGTALALATTKSFDVAIVDRMVPNIDGLRLVKALRVSGFSAPILFLTSLGGVDDRVEGLDAGGDDYLTKPFAFSELLARVNALARRSPLRTDTTVLRVSDLELDLVGRTVTREGQRIDLQPREFRLLEVLMRNAGRVMTRTMLLERVWDFHFDPKTSVVETHISRLRAKIDRPFDAELIQTVRGTGYKIDAPG